MVTRSQPLIPTYVTTDYDFGTKKLADFLDKQFVVDNNRNNEHQVYDEDEE